MFKINFNDEDDIVYLIIHYAIIILLFFSIGLFTVVYLEIVASVVIEIIFVNIDFVAIFISGSILITTVLYTKINKKNLHHKIIVDLRKEYDRPQKMYAIQRLWRFFRIDCKENKKKIKEMYIKKYEEFNRNLYDKLEDENYKMSYDYKMKRIQNSLAYQRRTVVSFYNLLADIHFLGLLPDNILFEMWDSQDLRIIKDILIPMQNVQYEMDKTEESGKRTNKRLLTLYNDSIEYKKSKIND